MSAERIRELNDEFRRSFSGGKVMMTAGIAAMSEDTRRHVLDRVRTFEAFTADVGSRWRAVSHRWGRFRHPALRTGRASFPASGSPCATKGCGFHRKQSPIQV